MAQVGGCVLLVPAAQRCETPGGTRTRSQKYFRDLRPGDSRPRTVRATVTKMDVLIDHEAGFNDTFFTGPIRPTCA